MSESGGGGPGTEGSDGEKETTESLPVFMKDLRETAWYNEKWREKLIFACYL